MMRFITLLVFLVHTAFGVDATLEVIKSLKNVPSIEIEDSSATQGDLSAKVIKMLEADLKVTGHFKVKQGMNSIFENDIDYVGYLKRGTDLVLKVKSYTEYNNVVSEIKIYDVNLNRVVFRKSYTVGKIERYPFLSHKITIDANDYIKAPSVAWMNKFVIFSRYLSPSESEILISDYTLTFTQVVAKNGLNIFPKWADDKQEEFYFTKYNKKPTLYKQNIYTGERVRITESEGMLACSDVSDDGRYLLLTMAPQDQADIYRYDTVTKNLKQITKYKGIDVSGQFSEDGNIIFVSDRLGYPNIFLKKGDSDAVERVVYHGKNNNACSAYKEYVVYTSRETDSEFATNTFNLFLVSTKSDYIRRLTASGENQFPKFSEDGETILHIKHNKNQSALGIIRLNYNKSFLFPLNAGKIQSIDW